MKNWKFQEALRSSAKGLIEAFFFMLFEKNLNELALGPCTALDSAAHSQAWFACHISFKSVAVVSLQEMTLKNDRTTSRDRLWYSSPHCFLCR